MAKAPEQHSDPAVCQKCRLEFSPQALFCPNCGTAKNRQPDGDPVLGTTVGDRYQLIEQIGQGASGAIYRAEHVTLRRRVAVKVLHDELSRDDLAIERFRREATTVGELQNDHIVEIYDFGRTPDNRLYLAMEYLEGQTLADILEEKGRLDVETVVDVLTQVGEALIEAHAMGYIHRDLRPRNIFLSVRRNKANFVKLLDFGLAKLVEHEGEAASTSLGMTFGDPHYMSPEQAKGEPVDRRCDIYSMGCIAYQMLTGHPPFHGGKVFDVLTRQVEEAPRPLIDVAPDVPAWLDKAVMTCLAKKAEDRYITVYRLVEALRQGTDSGVIMSDEMARRRPTDPPPSVSRAMERFGIEPEEYRAAQEGGDARERVRNKVADVAAESGAMPKIGSTTVAGVAAPKKSEFSAPTELPIDDAPVERARVGSEGVERDRVDTQAKTSLREPKLAKTRLAPVESNMPEAASVVDPNAEKSSGLSAVWYADGETFDGGDALDEGAQAKLDKARGRTPSRSGITAVSDDDLYDELPTSGNMKKVALGVGGLVLLVVIAALAWPSSDKKKDKAVEGEPAETVAAADETPTDTKPTPALASDDADAGAADVVPADPTPADAKPTDPKPADSKPKDPKPRDPKPRDPKPRDTKPSDGPLANLNFDKPRDPKPRDPKPKDPKPNGSGGVSAEDKQKAAELAAQGSRDFHSGDILGAASAFKKAKELDPKNAAAYTGLGEIALSQGAYGAAVGHLTKASRLRSGNARVLTLLGEAHLGAGNNAKAADAFKRSLKIRPDNPRARDGYNEAIGE